MGAYQEFYGLKDKDGNEYIVRYGGSVKDGLQIIPIKQPQNELKAGRWYVFEEKPQDIIFRICGVYGKDSYIEGYRFDNGSSREDGDLPRDSISAERSRFATDEEIESHLQKMAEKKGFKRGVSYKNLNGLINRIEKEPYFHYTKGDALMITGVDRHLAYDYIYEKGRWAEIVPEKKKLPKTKEEFKSFLTSHIAYAGSYCEIDGFLDQYEG